MSWACLFYWLDIITITISLANQLLYRLNKVFGDVDALFNILFRHVEEAVVVTLLTEPLEIVVEATIINRQQACLDVVHTKERVGSLMTACLQAITDKQRIDSMEYGIIQTICCTIPAF